MWQKEERKRPCACSASLLGSAGKGEGGTRECDVPLTLGRDRGDSLILGCYLNCAKALDQLPAAGCRRQMRTFPCLLILIHYHLPVFLRREREMVTRQKHLPSPSCQLTLHSVHIPTESGPPASLGTILVIYSLFALPNLLPIPTPLDFAPRGWPQGNALTSGYLAGCFLLVGFSQWEAMGRRRERLGYSFLPFPFCFAAFL